MAHFPFFVDVEGKKRLIAGEGRVSLCKVRDLLLYGATTRVVPTDLSAGLLELGANPVHKGRLTLSRRALEDRDLLNADFVIAAISDQVLNSHISTACHRQGIPANVVDVKEECSFVFPFIVRDGSVVMGISTGGASPAVVRYLRTRINRILPDSPGDPAQQPSGHRGWTKVLLPHSPEVRSGLFYELAEEGLENGCRLTFEQAEIIINRKLEQEHE